MDRIGFQGRKAPIAGRLDQRGQAIVEYLVVGVGVILALIAFQGAIRSAIDGVFTNTANKVIEAAGSF